MTAAEGWDRLERALELAVEFRAAGRTDRERWLAEHAELRDLLEPLLDTETEAEAERDSARCGMDGRVIGDFRIVRELGRGGMGVVYEARQISLQRRVALKVLDAHPVLSAAAVARFRREAQTAAGLDHPGIVRVLATGSEHGCHWFAMELVDGRTLEEVVADARVRGEGPEHHLRRMVEVCAAIAQALDYAHRRRVVHRDVKPGNLMLCADGRAVLTDFGLARESANPSLTAAGGMVGTPHYMAPEQAAGQPADARSDVFSLGATLYFLLTFECPFPGDTSEAVLRRIATHEPVDPRRFNRALPADLVAVVSQALRKDPKRRYQTAAELAGDLQAFLEFRPVRARRVGRVERGLRAARRRPVHAAAIAAVCAAVPAIAGMAGFVLARLPEIHAGQQQQLADLIESGWTFLASNHRFHADARAVMDRWLAVAANDPEAITLNALVIDRWEGGPRAALAWLDAHAAELAASAAMRRTQELLLRGCGETERAAEIAAGLPAPRGYLDVYVAGVVEQAKAGAGDREAARRALEYSELAARLTPRPRLGFYLAWAVNVSYAGDANDRRRCIAALTALWPDSSRAWCAVAELYAVDQPRAAVEACERALQIFPDEAGLLEQLGMLREQAQDAEGAAQAWRRLTEVQPMLAPAHRGLGRCLLALGRTDEAARALDRAAALAPLDPGARAVRVRLGGAAPPAEGDGPRPAMRADRDSGAGTPPGSRPQREG